MNEAIVAKDLSIAIKGKDILTRSSFSFDKGDIVLLDGRNGTGKTTLIKVLLGRVASDVTVNGEVRICGSENILQMKNKELLAIQSRIACLDQKDEFESYYGIPVITHLQDSLEAFRGKKLTASDKEYIEETFNTYLPSNAGFTLKSKISKLSGGQQRIVSIIASICLRRDSDVFFIDEPLNNLDMNAVVQISNILNKLRIERPDIVMVMVSHCKIFPFISKVATLEDGIITIRDTNLTCHACFGQPDGDGFYE